MAARQREQAPENAPFWTASRRSFESNSTASSSPFPRTSSTPGRSASRIVSLNCRPRTVALSIRSCSRIASSVSAPCAEAMMSPAPHVEESRLFSSGNTSEREIVAPTRSPSRW